MTERYLLDTNVLSEWMRPQPDSAMLTWVGQQSPDRLHTSAITVAGEVIAMRRRAGGDVAALPDACSIAFKPF